MASHNENRNSIINRVTKELIGPGSDEFNCSPDFLDEIIEGKPLQRYFSAILFPKQLGEYSDVNIDNDEDDIIPETEDTIHDISPEEENEQREFQKQINFTEPAEDNRERNYLTNAFFPSQFGLSFCLDKVCQDFELIVSFGNYKKAKFSEIELPYSGIDIDLLSRFGFDRYVSFNNQTKMLCLTKEIKRTEKKQITEDYKILQSAFQGMREDFREHILYKTLTKLFFKNKYKRNNNKIPILIKTEDLLKSDNNRISINLSQQENVDSGNWHKNLNDNLILHLKLYVNKSNKFFVKAILENKYLHRKDQFSLAKEKLNQLAIFQCCIEINCNYLLPFKDYQSNLYKSGEDKMLDFLYRNKMAYGIGHNTSCTWENCGDDSLKPMWIKTTFLPEFDVKSQSTKTSKIDSEILLIKNLSSFNTDKASIIKNLEVLQNAYIKWIEDEYIDKENGYIKTNIEKCKQIKSRIENGINLLNDNEKAFQAFQYANTAIYLQMFQTKLNFSDKKDGFEVFEERFNPIQFSYDEYRTKPFPKIQGEKDPSWHPFQLAFILQSLPSFIEEESPDREIADLLYFPTGGGKTEAYLAIAAFLIFWRRLQYPNQYDGVNIIIRYTLRLLSAQQFERASKLILACEFIRQNNKNLGSEKVSIGFWVGGSTIPNKLKGNNGGNSAEYQLNKIHNYLNRDNKKKEYINNPFQVSNCQWCNTKIISRLEDGGEYIIGHRINKRLMTHCLNPECNFHSELPVVLVDDDIYSNPPSVLFGTVDKFARLAWEGRSTSLFNYKNNRKPELIIQDELHLLNGPLGSLVGLFENVIVSLCTDQNQKPKIIASTATIKNVDKQTEGLYGKKVNVFPQFASNADDTFFSKTQSESKRRYVGVMPTGKTTVMTNIRLIAALLYARLEIYLANPNDVDQFWTLLSYFKSLKELGRFSNKITSELQQEIKQLQVRHLQNNGNNYYNYGKLSYRKLELTSRIPNEKIKKNLDKLDISFENGLKEYKAYDLVMATNMISVGLDVERLGIMVMNGIPPNVAEYIQASSRVARKNEGVVFTLFDPFNSRDLSYFEDFIQFHKTFYKQVEPLSVTPFADNALDKMLFTILITYFRHKLGYASNEQCIAFLNSDIRNNFKLEIIQLFKNHPFIVDEEETILQKIEALLDRWKFRLEANNELKYYWYQNPEKSLMKPIKDKLNEADILTAMQSMRSVEPDAEISIKQN